MGEKRPTIRTLPSGEKVRHFPADDRHPEGRMELIRDRSALREALNASRDDNRACHDELAARHGQRIENKKADQRDKGLPPEKSFF